MPAMGRLGPPRTRCSRHHACVGQSARRAVAGRTAAATEEVEAQTAQRTQQGRSDFRIKNAPSIEERKEYAGYGSVGFTYEDFESALDEHDGRMVFEVGSFVTGSVASLDNRGAYVDIGAKALAFCPVEELSNARVSRASDVLQLGMVREFQVVAEDNRENVLIVSLKGAESKVAWKRIRQMAAEDVTVLGKVSDSNRGGVIVSVEGVQGFVPSSHLAVPISAAGAGEVLPLKFLETDEIRQRLVLSNRRAKVEKQVTFKVGDVVVGTIASLKPYGAFVDIGGVNGLLHISQLSHERIANINSVISVGQQVKVMVLSQDTQRGRVSLSTKKLEPTPGDMINNPDLVYEQAETMAEAFKQRVAAAEAAARAEEAKLASEIAGKELGSAAEAAPEPTAEA